MPKSIFHALESHSRKFEDEANGGASIEAEISVDVSTAEGEDDAVELAETVHESEEIVEGITEAENTEATLRFYIDILKKHGAQPATVALMNVGNGLSNISGVSIPAVESLDSVGRNQRVADQMIKACEVSMAGVWDSIKKFFISLWERIKAMGRWIMNKFSSYESACIRAYNSIKGRTINAEKAKDAKFKSIKLGKLVGIISGVIRISAMPVSDVMSMFDADGKPTADTVKLVEGFGFKFNESNDGLEDDDKTKLDSEEIAVKDLTVDLLTQFYNGPLKQVISSKTKIANSIKRMEDDCQTAIKEADQMARMDSTSDTDAQKDAQKHRTALKLTVSIFNKCVGKVGLIFNAFIKHCAAVRPCTTE